MSTWKNITELAANARKSMVYTKSTYAFDELLKQYPYDGMVHYNLGMAYKEIGDYENAVKSLKLAKSIFPMKTWKDIAEAALNKIPEKYRSVAIQSTESTASV